MAGEVDVLPPRKKKSDPAAVEAGIPISDTQAMMAVIERAARDKDVDVTKMERLWVMRNELREQQKQDQAEERERDFHNALADAQAAMTRVAADSSNPQTRSKYASLAALDRAIRPHYTGKGFSVSFDTEMLANGDLRITGFLARNGHTVRRQVDQPADGKGAKGGDVMTRTHAHKAAITYGRRELLEMFFNLATGKDTDGNIDPPVGPTITEKQAGEINKLFEAIDSDALKDIVLGYYKIESIAELPASAFKTVIERLEKHKRDAGSNPGDRGVVSG